MKRPAVAGLFMSELLVPGALLLGAVVLRIAVRKGLDELGRTCGILPFHGPLAQWWSRGLIILWLSVRARQGPPRKLQPRSAFASGLFCFRADMRCGLRCGSTPPLAFLPAEFAFDLVILPSFKLFEKSSCQSQRLPYNTFLRAARRTFLGSSTAEHPAVNRRVVGSNPTRGAIFIITAAQAAFIWAYGAAGARFLHTEEVTGSNPVTPTIELPASLRVGFFVT